MKVLNTIIYRTTNLDIVVESLSMISLSTWIPLDFNSCSMLTAISDSMALDDLVQFCDSRGRLAVLC